MQRFVKRDALLGQQAADSQRARISVIKLRIDGIYIKRHVNAMKLYFTHTHAVASSRTGIDA